MMHIRSVRFRLLAAANTAIVLLLGVFLILDYRQEIVGRVAEKHTALEEETKTLLPAVLRIRLHGDQAVQRYIDDVCGRMQDSSSPGHHIAVQMNATVLQAVAHHRASTAIFEAMRQAATHRRLVSQPYSGMAACSRGMGCNIADNRGRPSHSRTMRPSAQHPTTSTLAMACSST
jgi:hypothetical protein